MNTLKLFDQKPECSPVVSEDISSDGNGKAFREAIANIIRQTVLRFKIMRPTENKVIR